MGKGNHPVDDRIVFLFMQIRMYTVKTTCLCAVLFCSRVRMGGVTGLIENLIPEAVACRPILSMTR